MCAVTGQALCVNCPAGPDGAICINAAYYSGLCGCSSTTDCPTGLGLSCDPAKWKCTSCVASMSTLEVGTGWGGIGSWTSLALSGTGAFHISYYDGMSKRLKYATNSSGTLATSVVDSPDVGTNSSIALDSMGNVHIAYKYCQNSPWCDAGGLRYATNSSGTWVIQTMDSGNGSVGDGASLAVDKNDNIHIAYKNGGAKYVTNASGGWTSDVIDSVGDFTALAQEALRKVRHA